eukprot:1204335-Amphidinium_carterae.2
MQHMGAASMSCALSVHTFSRALYSAILFLRSSFAWSVIPDARSPATTILKTDELELLMQAVAHLLCQSLQWQRYANNLFVLHSGI